ncbi:DUF4394 domain-containing protein [Hymenobacter sp. BT188]|uniref:DUF4394 domain-containing protein n=1 Tax=Hymenobacter sp. BT188 TaxID=2763504 RepID=UPI00165141E1|nr:DUF4394 domain-containing protein [Hymenobacter sp. BT188]MBC6605879.1 DUF4394 domain-containing protein [Hymenobacter sp. BT188]
MLKTSSLAKWGVAALLLSSLTSCEDILEQYFPKPTPPPAIPTFPNLGLDIPFYALTDGTRLDGYSTKDPSTRTSSVAITGLQSGERILAMDFRPATGQLYGVGSSSRLYVINQNTGVARAMGSGAFMPTIMGELVGFDFNPTVDRIRLVTSTGQNLRLNPETGTVAATDGPLTGAPGSALLTGAAYTNNTAGATTTVLYAINTVDKQLYVINPPNNGTLVPVGALSLNVTGDGGFDIDAKTGTALGLYSVSGNPTLFSVDLSTGTARPLAQYNTNSGYSAIAIPTQPVAYAAVVSCSRARGCVTDLVTFNPTNPAAGFTSKPITGLRNELFRGIDFRPATSQLYAVGGMGGIYTINLTTGAATLMNAFTTFVPGVVAGFDFDPVTDVMRHIVAGGGENYRINPVSAAVIQDVTLNPGSTFIQAAAYDNNYAGASTTKLYVVDYNTDKLYQVNQPNTGNIIEIGSLGVNVGDDIHLDIGGISNTAYFVSTPRGVFNPATQTATRPGPTQLYTINLATGAATAIGEIDFISLSDRGEYQVFGFSLGLGF